MKNLIQLLLTGVMLSTLASCGGGGGSISTLATSDSFDDGNLDFNPKMDILWVVDPSNSMFEEVEKVRNNISTFIEGFIALGYEYRMGVISSSAWSRLAYEADESGLAFLGRSGVASLGNLHKGECADKPFANGQTKNYLDSLTEANVGNFLTKFNKYFDVYGVGKGTFGCGLVGAPFGNFAQVSGTLFENATLYGAGGGTAHDAVSRAALSTYINDERPLQSLRAYLESAEAANFIRNSVDPADNAHLAIIIVSDEADASRNSLVPSPVFVPNDPDNHTAQEYIDFLTTYKNGIENFSIYSIVDTALPVNIARDVAALSGGLAFDINATQEEYVENLGQMSQAILVSSSFFPIAHRPIPSTIEIEIVKENGTVVVVSRDTGSGGFTYISAQQGVTLSAEYLPAKGDTLKINYTPAQLISGVSDQPRLSLSSLSINERPSTAGASPNPGDVGYDADTFTKNGTVLGTVSLLYSNSLGGTFSLISDPTGAYTIDPVTGVIVVDDASLLDTETQGRHVLEVNLDMGGGVEFNKSFQVSIRDIADSSPVAGTNTYTVSESIADGDGWIRIIGNLSYFASGIDASEAHTYNINVGSLSPAISGATLTPASSSTGIFTYRVNIANLNGGAGLGSGDTEEIEFTYTISDASGNTSAPATIDLRIQGFNLPPVLETPIGNRTVEFDGDYGYLDAMVDNPISTSNISVSGIGSGVLANLIDNAASVFETSSDPGDAHYIQINFPVGRMFEVDNLLIQGASGHPLGNAVFQVLGQGSSVVTREVLPVTASNSLTVNMTTKVIGTGIRILRPYGAVNSANHANLRIQNIRIYGIEAEGFQIDLNNHFMDPDGDAITFFPTDRFGEGSAPAWVSVNGAGILEGIPPLGTHYIGVLARDTQGATAFTVFTVTRNGSGGGANNAAPIAVLPLDDTKRGGITLRRFGGRRESSPGVFVDCTSANNNCETAGNPATDNAIRHGEGDNFLLNPYAGEAIRAALIGQTPNHLDASTYRTVNNIPLVIRQSLITSGHEDQIPHFGDNYGSENGWTITPIHTDPKYPLASGTFCNQSVAANGRINPCIRDMRAYGDTYTGYFVPAKTGVYRFRSAQAVDDMVRLLMAPTEYGEDLTPVITSNHTGVQDLANSLYNILGDSYAANQEFSPNSHPAAGHNTSMFYEGAVTINQGSYRKGYLYLKQGNAYAFEIRFQEGGGSVQFAFEYDRKDISCNPTNSVTTSPGACWDGWAAIDASVLVPDSGTDAHTPQMIAAPGSVVSLDVKTQFYDAEQDTLEYTARLVTPEGTLFGTGNISQIGLSLDAQTGLLTGTLNSAYDGAAVKPRIVFTVTEVYTTNHAQTSSLPIKFDVTP